MQRSLFESIVSNIVGHTNALMTNTEARTKYTKKQQTFMNPLSTPNRTTLQNQLYSIQHATDMQRAFIHFNFKSLHNSERFVCFSSQIYVLQYSHSVSSSMHFLRYLSLSPDFGVVVFPALVLYAFENCSRLSFIITNAIKPIQTKTLPLPIP